MYSVSAVFAIPIYTSTYMKKRLHDVCWELKIILLSNPVNDLQNRFAPSKNETGATEMLKKSHLFNGALPKSIQFYALFVFSKTSHFPLTKKKETNRCCEYSTILSCICLPCTVNFCEDYYMSWNFENL